MTAIGLGPVRYELMLTSRVALLCAPDEMKLDGLIWPRNPLHGFDHISENKNMPSNS